MVNKQLLKRISAICLVSAMTLSNSFFTPNIFNFTSTFISADTSQTFSISTLSNGNGSVTPNKTSVNYGDSVTIQIAANTNYIISKVTINGQEQSISPQTVSTSLTIPACYSNYTVYVEFARPSFTVTTSNNGNGSINISSSNVLKGDSLTINAVPNDGYFVKTISVNGNIMVTNDANATTVTNGFELQNVNANIDINVTFEKLNQSNNDDTSTVTLNTGLNGTIEASATTFQNGSDLSFNVKADTGYKISSLKINGQSQVINDNISSFSFSLKNVAQNITIEAFFEPVIFNVKTSKTGSGTISIENASLKQGDNLALSFTPDNGYQVQDVIVNGVSYGAIKGFTIENIQSDYDVQVIFIPTENIEYSITVIPSEHGKVTPSAYTFKGGENIQIDFKPDNGYKVSQIILDGTIYNKESSSITLENSYANHTIEVIFEPISTQAVAGDINGDGAVTTADLVMLKKQLCGKISFINASDVNKDNKINVFDLLYIVRNIIYKK